jgi:dUTP pyrophosphatase
MFTPKTINSDPASHSVNIENVYIQLGNTYKNSKLPLPTYAEPFSAGIDLYAIDIIENSYEVLWFDTDIKMMIPPGYYGDLRARSSISKTGLVLANGCGVIDSSYRGNIQVRFHKMRPMLDMDYRIGDKIAQLILTSYSKINLIEQNELGTSIRGEGGFGSTGR